MRRAAINRSLVDASISLQEAYAQAMALQDLPLASQLRDIAKDIGVAVSRNQHINNDRAEITS